MCAHHKANLILLPEHNPAVTIQQSPPASCHTSYYACAWRRRRQRFNAESDGEDDYSESEKSRSARSTPERSSYEERQARSDSDDDSDDGGQFQVSLIDATVSRRHASAPYCHAQCAGALHTVVTR